MDCATHDAEYRGPPQYFAILAEQCHWSTGICGWLPVVWMYFGHARMGPSLIHHLQRPRGIVGCQCVECALRCGCGRVVQFLSGLELYLYRLSHFPQLPLPELGLIDSVHRRYHFQCRTIALHQSLQSPHQKPYQTGLVHSRTGRLYPKDSRLGEPPHRPRKKYLLTSRQSKFPQVKGARLLRQVCQNSQDILDNQNPNHLAIHN